MKKKKKNNKKKIAIKRVFALVIILVLIAIFAHFFLNNKQDIPLLQTSAMKTLSTYMSYANDRDYAKMYEMIATTSKNNTSKEKFIEKNKTVYEQIEARDISVTNMKEEEEDNRKNKDSLYK